MSELNPDSRMQRRGVGDLMHPGCCAVCGNGTCEEGYIDLGVYYDYEGQVYLCMPCVNELADTAGLLTDAEAQYLASQNNLLAERHAKMEHELEAAHDRLKHFDALFTDKFDTHPDVLADLESQNEQASNESSDEPVNDGATEESITDEPVIIEGHSDISGSEPADRSNGIDL